MGILEVNNIGSFYGQKKNITKDLNRISFSIEEEEKFLRKTIRIMTLLGSETSYEV